MRLDLDFRGDQGKILIWLSQSRRDNHVTKMSMAHNNNNNVNVAGHGQQASTMRDVIRLFQEKEELELELKEAEELQLQLEEGWKQRTFLPQSHCKTKIGYENQKFWDT